MSDLEYEPEGWWDSKYGGVLWVSVVAAGVVIWRHPSSFGAVLLIQGAALCGLILQTPIAYVWRRLLELKVRSAATRARALWKGPGRQMFDRRLSQREARERRSNELIWQGV